MNIQISELKNIKKLSSRGLSWSTIYAAQFKERDVIVKAQDKGSLEKTNKDDRFAQELNVLKLGLEGIVTLIGYGDDFDGERFVVLEKLEKLPVKFTLEQATNIIGTALMTSRQLYLHGFNWVAILKHVMLDCSGKVKLIDFGDDNMRSLSFLRRHQAYDIIALCEEVCKSANLSTGIIDGAMTKLIESEYQSLENVHEPIFFEPYAKFYRTETESDDPNFGKLVPPNRQCVDRKKMILDTVGHLSLGKTCLDIGCNVGWFTFLMQQQGFSSTGIDFDKGKIEFNKLLAELNEVKATFLFADVNVDYVNKMAQYDVILALSILHLYFIQHKVSRAYWFELFEGICKKANEIFIFETSGNILRNIGVESFGEFMKLAKRIGEFSKVESIGSSDAKRPLIVCTK